MYEILEGKKRAYFKIIDELEFNFVFEGCPVQVLRGRTVSDIESGKIYLSLDFLNVGEKAVEGIGFQIFFYDGKNLPFDKPDFFFDLKKAPPEAIVADKKPPKHIKSVGKNLLFGNDYFIELTDKYFKKIDIGITEIAFADGTREAYNAVSRSEYSSFDALNVEEITAYKDINIYAEAEESHPARVIPTRDELTWVCCCGAKNPADAEKCAVCGRERDWQFQNLTVENLDRVIDDYSKSDAARRHRASELRSQALSNSNFSARQKEENERRAREGIERAEQQQKIAETRRKRIISIVFIWLVVLAAYLVISNITQGAR